MRRDSKRARIAVRLARVAAATGTVITAIAVRRVKGRAELPRTRALKPTANQIAKIGAERQAYHKRYGVPM